MTHTRNLLDERRSMEENFHALVERRRDKARLREQLLNRGERAVEHGGKYLGLGAKNKIVCILIRKPLTLELRRCSGVLFPVI